MTADWPVLPDGVEGVLLFRAPDGYMPETASCFVCDEAVTPRERCWGVPGHGTAHERCYEPED